MVQLNENIVGIDAAIFMHPTTWKASGHVDAFNDPLIDNKETKKRYRVDHLLNDQEACIFENITAGDYNIRLIYDKNQNQKWDTGNYLKKINPERTIHNLEKIKIRANWIIRENI